jgi:fructose-1,6-bisphosphatase I
MTEENLPSTDLITLTRYVFIVDVYTKLGIDSSRHILAEQSRLGAAATGDLTMLLNAIQLTSKFISTNVRKARLLNL